MIIVKIQDLQKVGKSQYARVCESANTTYLNETNYEIQLASVEFEDTFYSCKGWDCPINGILDTDSGGTKCGVSSDGNHRHLMYHFQGSTILKYDTSCDNYENAYLVNQPDQKGYVIGCPNGLELYTQPVMTNAVTMTSNSLSHAVTPSPLSQLHITSNLPITPSSSNLPITPSESLILSGITSISNSRSFQDTFSNSPWVTNEPLVLDELFFPNEHSGESSDEAFASTPTPETTTLTSRGVEQSNEVVNLDKASAQLGAGAIIGIVFASIAGFTILTVLVGVAGFVLLNLSSKGSVGSYSFSKTTITDKV